LTDNSVAHRFSNSPCNTSKNATHHQYKQDSTWYECKDAKTSKKIKKQETEQEEKKTFK
jgi:hypothetical protein